MKLTLKINLGNIQKKLNKMLLGKITQQNYTSSNIMEKMNVNNRIIKLIYNI
jgi:hypothetical protein